MFIDMDRTLFGQRAFQVMDEDGDGTIDFREFVISVWNYCTFMFLYLCGDFVSCAAGSRQYVSQMRT